MNFLKKNYEKILLGLVLLGLTVAVALLPIIISSKRDKLKQLSEGLKHPKVKALPPPDVGLEDAALKRVQSAYRLDFAGRHNLLNPVIWVKNQEGHPVKILPGTALSGPELLVITGITPLYLRLAFDSVSGTSYLIGVENQAAAQASRRVKGQKLAAVGGKNDLFTLQGIKGPPDNPTELDLVINESGEPIPLAPGKPFERVDGYSVDLKYPPENNRLWKSKRVNDVLPFAGAQYKIVAITQSNAVILAPNDKKTTINFTNSISPMP